MTSTAKTVLFWIMNFLMSVLLYHAAQHGGRASNVASAKQIPGMRLGNAELLMIFIVALIVFAPVIADRQRFNALKARFNLTFNRTFFIVLSGILAIFTLADVWLR